MYVYRAAPSAPRNVTLREITSTYAVIDWVEPEFPDGVIRNYIVSLTNANDGTETIVTTDQLSANITGLDPFTQYWVVVFAETVAVGEGSFNFSIRTLQDSKQIKYILSVVHVCMYVCKYSGTHLYKDFLFN